MERGIGEAIPDLPLERKRADTRRKNTVGVMTTSNRAAACPGAARDNGNLPSAVLLAIRVGKPLPRHAFDGGIMILRVQRLMWAIPAGV